MSLSEVIHINRRNIADIANQLGAKFAERAADIDDNDTFVAENFAALRTSGLLEAGVPVQLGGGGASIDELAEMLRTLAHHCGSTALAFAMHTHQVAFPAWRWAHQPDAPVEPLLKRIAQEKLFLLSSGGSDWIGGSGRAEKVEGGYRITARKVFTSGAPTGDLLMTSAVLDSDSATEPASVLHFAIPMTSPHVKIVETWCAMGMRGTGSHDVIIDRHIVPEAGVSVRRPQGEWHPLFVMLGTIAFPLIYAVYLGVAEQARDRAIALAKRKTASPHAIELAGRMETELTAAQLAHKCMLDAARLNAPTAQTVNQVMTGKALLTRHAIAAVEHALELAGGAGFYRSAGLERCFRDIQAARYHPLQAGAQTNYAGAMALGLPLARIW